MTSITSVTEICTVNDSISKEEIQHLVGRSNPVILDIGCNDGTHTQMFFDLFENASVYSFEPDPRAYNRFKNIVKHPRSRIFATAIGAFDGKIEFHQSEGIPDASWVAKRPEGWDYSGSIRKPKQHLTIHPWCQFSKKIEVDIMRLDTWVKNEKIDKIDFIWADVQGAEVDLINGGYETLTQTRFLYTEYNDLELYEGQVTLSKLLDMLPDFEIVHKYQDDVLLRNKLL